MKILNKVFSVNINDGSHYSLIIFGIKFHILKYSMFRNRKIYAEKYMSYSDITAVPPAEGNLRLIQLANVSLLKMFAKVCEAHNLKYWLDFGTLLGAVRHKGFIPWDDDIDVGMPREDYESLVNLYETEQIVFEDCKLYFKNNKRNKCFLKLQYNESKNVTLDIFPYDWYYKPLNEEEKEILSGKISKLVNINKFRFCNNEKLIREKFKTLTKDKLLDGKLLNLNNYPALFMAIDFPHKWNRKVYDYETVFPLSNISFEGCMFNAPNYPEIYLKSIYGDFMSFPKDLYPRHSAYLGMSKNEVMNLKEFIK